MPPFGSAWAGTLIHRRSDTPYLTDDEKVQIKAGRCAVEIWPEKPAKARPSDVDARWTLQRSQAKTRTDGAEPTALAVPLHGYKSHVSVDRMRGIVRR